MCFDAPSRHAKASAKAESLRSTERINGYHPAHGFSVTAVFNGVPARILRNNRRLRSLSAAYTPAIHLTALAGFEFRSLTRALFLVFTFYFPPEGVSPRAIETASHYEGYYISHSIYFALLYGTKALCGGTYVADGMRRESLTLPGRRRKPAGLARTRCIRCCRSLMRASS